MRAMLILGILVLCSISIAEAEVKLNGDLIIQSSIVGAKYLGEVINDTEIPITKVKVVVTVKDSSEKVIDVADGYVDGYTDPTSSFLDSYIPVGEKVPFYFFGDANAEEVVTFSVNITYETTDAIIANPDEVTIKGELNIVDDFLGATLYGEVENNAVNIIYYVKVVTAIKDAEGNILEVETSYVEGQNYMVDEIYNNDTMIRPGSSAPFYIMSLVESTEIGSYYTIINYDTATESTYQYPGEDQIDIKGEINVVDSFIGAKYLGEISNNSDYDIYFTSITVVSRDSEDIIFDISNAYVDGSSFEYSEGSTTDTHIAPGETAPFEMYSSATVEEIVSYDYIINYSFAENSTVVAESTPHPFILKGNYPNPFNPTTTIDFSLSEQMPIELFIYNSSGQKIAELINRNMDAGNHSVTWNASRFTSGVYFYKLTANNRSESRKLLFLK